MMKNLSGLTLALLVTLSISAQDSSRAELSFYADALVNSSRPENRIRAAGEFYSRFKTYISTPESISNSFQDLPWLSVVTPADSTFRVITWQVEENDAFRYYGFIQFLSEEDLSHIELRDTRSLNSEYAAYDKDTWYGSVYYGIQPFVTTDKKIIYIILGFNAHTKQINQRVADILTIQDSNLAFGMPLFFTNDTTEVKSRILMEYADAASATMRFDREKELLIYDHVIPINTPEGPALVPDGSYHGFAYKKGMWHFIDTVFDVISEQPPGGREKESTKRDLFGREAGKKNE